MAEIEQEFAATDTDADLLTGALSDASVDDTQSPEAAAEAQGQPRDEHGRFAPRAQNEPPEQPPQAQQTEQGQPQAPAEAAHIPPGRLREEAEARRAAEARAERLEQQMMQLMARLSQPQAPAQPQQPEQAPDFYLNPEEAVSYTFKKQLDPVLDQFQRTLDYNSRLAANAVYTEQVVSEAEKAFMAAVHNRTVDPADYERVVGAPNRYEAAVQWHRRQTVLSEVGTDPNAWFEKKLEERMNDPAFLAKAIERVKNGGGQPAAGAVPARNVVQLPPSLNKATGSAASAGDADFDMSDAGLLRDALRRK